MNVTEIVVKPVLALAVSIQAQIISFFKDL